MTSAPQPRRRRGAPPAGERLTRAAVLAAAESLVTTDGLDAFSMRRLAAALGVRPNALYNHVRDREHLLTLLAERFLGGFVLPGGDGPWPTWLAEVARALRDRLRGQPELTRVALSRAGTTAAGPELLTGFHDRLEEAGLEPALVHTAWHALLTLVVGTAQQEQVLGRDQGAVFDAVLDLTVTGIVVAATEPVSGSADALLRAHSAFAPPSPG